MKQKEKCSGRRFDPAHLHQKHIVSDLVWVDDLECAFDGGVHGFDRAKSNRVDSRVGDDPKSSKTK